MVLSLKFGEHIIQMLLIILDISNTTEMLLLQQKCIKKLLICNDG